MLTFSKLGKHGNLGNQLFEIASTIGIARKNEMPYVFPRWKYAKDFKFPIPQSNHIHSDIQIDEPHYHYADIVLDRAKNIDLLGWFQSEKYFDVNYMGKYFLFADKVIDRCMILDEQAFKPNVPVCAISVRRGDYVGNENYYELDMRYYAGAAEKMLKQFGNLNFLVFSDDLDWCKDNFIKPVRTSAESVFQFNHSRLFFTKTKTPIDQLASMSLCDHFIIANSSFSWWGAWLGELNNKKAKVIAPAKWNAGPLLARADDKDVIPDRWEKWLPEKVILKRTGKIDLSDVTFTIPIKYDHADRKANLDLCIKYLQHHFDTNISLGEMDDRAYFNYHHKTVEYRFFKKKQLFERTWILNELAKEAQTPIVANWDADVFMDPDQVLEAVSRIRKGEADGCYPYDGRFFHASRERYYDLLDKELSTEIFRNQPFSKHDHTVTSYGGCVIWNKQKFIEGGMENEHMVDYGPEDYERYHRFKKLGFNLSRVSGPLFHIDHEISRNGSQGHARYQSNHFDYERLMKLSKSDLKKEVSAWPWPKAIVKKLETPGKNQYNHPIWQQIKPDAIYLVNLKRREDKLKNAFSQFELVGLEGVTVVEAIDGYALQLKSPIRQLSPGMLGCYQTHEKIIKQALEQGFTSIVVFEDDIQFIPAANEMMEVAFSTIPEDWNFVYLGANEYGGLLDFKKRVSENWVVPKSVWGTHGYMIRTREAMVRILNMLQLQKMQLDNQLSQVVLPNSALNYYSIFPSVVDQWLHESSDVQVANPEVRI